MKKLLMIGAILAMGAIVYGADAKIDETSENTNEATVTVKAKLVAENLVISDLEGNPIVLDFGRVSKTRDSGTSEAQTGYMVRFVGDTSNMDTEAEKALTMELLNKDTGAYMANAVPVRLASLTQLPGEKADTFDVTVGLNTYTGVMPEEAEAGHDYPEFIGTVFGTLDHNNANPMNNGSKANALADLDSGDYQGETLLKVSINGGQDFGA